MIDAPVASGDRDVAEIQRSTVAQFQYDAAIRPVGVRQCRETDDVAAEIVAECRSEIRSRDAVDFHGLGIEGNDPFERCHARQRDFPDAFGLGQRGRHVGFDILFDASGGKIGLDRINQHVRLPGASRGDGDGRVADLFRQLRVEVPDRRRHFEPGCCHFRPLAETNGDATASFGRA